MSSSYLIVGLGNPGQRYEATYHNCGWMALDACAEAFQIHLDQTKFQSLYGTGKVGAHKLYLVKPLTYMNNSGLAVAAFMNYFRIEAQQVMIIYDDFDLPAGQLRLRSSGGAGTHNGMKSVIQHLKTQAFPRLRLGIGPLPANWSVVDFVLSIISESDAQKIGDCFPKVIQAIQYWMDADIQLAMNRVNQRLKG